jgi:hypothetical protein
VLGWVVALPVPSFFFTATGSAEADEFARGVGFVGVPKPASTSLVPVAGVAPPFQPGSFAHQNATPGATAQRGHASEIAGAEFARRSVLGALAAEAGLSSKAGDLIQCEVAKTTNKVYCARWQKFVWWCQRSHVSPLDPTPAQIANYLFETYELGARYATVRGLLTTGAHTLRLKPSLQNLGVHPIITAIFPAMRRGDFARQPSRVLGWDLDLVLRDLASLSDPQSNLQMTYKALFLLAFLRAHECRNWQPCKHHHSSRQRV